MLSLVSTGTTTTISTQQWRKAARNLVQKKAYFGAVATYSIVKNTLDLKTICVFTTVSFVEFTNILAFCNYVARGGYPERDRGGEGLGIFMRASKSFDYFEFI